MEQFLPNINSTKLENLASLLSGIIVRTLESDFNFNFHYINIVTDNFANKTALNKYRLIKGSQNLLHLAIAERLTISRCKLVCTWAPRKKIQAADYLSKQEFSKFQSAGSEKLFVHGKWRVRAYSDFRILTDQLRKLIKQKNRIFKLAGQCITRRDPTTLLSKLFNGAYPFFLFHFKYLRPGLVVPLRFK